MTNREIVELLGRERVVEGMIRRITDNSEDDTLQDLSQDIYESLLGKENKKLNDLYNNKTLNYFISKMLMNNICSNTSPYYRRYIKPFKDCEDISALNTDNYDD